MDENLYDEFGNYIGPDLGSSGDDSEEDEGVRGRPHLARRQRLSLHLCSRCCAVAIRMAGWMMSWMLRVTAVKM